MYSLELLLFEFAEATHCTGFGWVATIEVRAKNHSRNDNRRIFFVNLTAIHLLEPPYAANMCASNLVPGKLV